MKMFKKTYSKKKNSFQTGSWYLWVQKWNEWSAQVIFVSEKETSGRIPTQAPIKSPAIGFISHRRMGGTWSRRNLMNARLGCQSIKSVRWVVKKVLMQTEMMYDKSRVIVVISKSSFLPEEQERRISKGYCRYDRPSSMDKIGLCPFLSNNPAFYPIFQTN